MKTILYKIALYISILGIIAFIVDFGFSQNSFEQHLLDGFFFLVLAVGILSTFFRYKEHKFKVPKKILVFDVLTLSFTFWIFYLYLFVGVPFTTDLLLENPLWVKIAVVFTFIRELSQIKVNYKQTLLNPAQLFIVSFLVIIIMGAFLLMLPKATFEGISFIDALFTSTSAVCVTGLIVVDTGSYFTQFGQLIILLLIQIGGIGILTISSYFSYFFKGKTTYDNQMIISNLTSSQKIGDVFKTLKNIIIITFGIEFITAILVYLSISTVAFENGVQKIFFAVFHAISAFCNAGFSTLYDGLYDIDFKFNYLLQCTLIMAFIIGGLGFPIIQNAIKYLKYLFLKVISLGKKQRYYQPWVLHINSRITLFTTFIIMLVATILFYFLEYNNTLNEHQGFGKVITALFSASTPRTAGFNTINFSELLLPSTLLIILLMWIGASPASTGGGIKTSTFAVIFLNMISVAKGKSRLEIFRREISQSTIYRAFAVVSLSVLVIGLGIMLISVFDPDKSLRDITFECFSAYSTVGLSLGITASLSVYSKITVIFLMFVGRVSMLTLLIALVKKNKYTNYRYPTEELTIN